MTQKVEKVKNFHVLSAGCSLLRAAWENMLDPDPYPNPH
jgi:hypothetical protein